MTRRRAIRGAAVLAASAVVAIVTAIVFRIALATALIERALAGSGFPDAHFTIEALSIDGIRIARLDAGKALHIERIDALFDFSRLPGSPIGRIRLAGARIELPETGAANPDGERPGSSGDLPLGLLPALELEDVELTIPSPAGPVRMRLGSHVTQADGSLQMQLEGTIEGSGADAALRAVAQLAPGGAVSMSVDVPSLRVRSGAARIDAGSAKATFDLATNGFAPRSGRGRIELALTGVAAGDAKIGTIAATMPLEFDHGAGGWSVKVVDGDLQLTEQGLHLGGVRGTASAEALELHVGRLEDSRRERRFEPLQLSARWIGSSPDARFTADLSAAGGRGKLHAEGSYGSAAGLAVVDVTLPRTKLDPEHLRPIDLSALLAPLGPVKGAVEGTARVRWRRGSGVEMSTKLQLDDVSTVAAGMAMDGVSGRLDLTGLTPPQTAGTQTLRIHRLYPGVELQDVSFGWALDPVAGAAGARLRIEKLAAGFAGGSMRVDDALLDPHAGANRLIFRFEDLDVARVFEFAGVQGVTGSGRLSGAVPVTVRDGAVSIEDGKLSAQHGVLQIDSKQAASMLAGRGQSVDLLLQALRDFHYERLEVMIEKALAGDASAAVRLEGNNPAVLDGYPFRINLNVSGNLDRLVGSLLEVARLSDRAVRATVHAMH